MERLDEQRQLRRLAANKQTNEGRQTNKEQTNDTAGLPHSGVRSRSFVPPRSRHCIGTARKLFCCTGRCCMLYIAQLHVATGLLLRLVGCILLRVPLYAVGCLLHRVVWEQPECRACLEVHKRVLPGARCTVHLRGERRLEPRERFVESVPVANCLRQTRAENAHNASDAEAAQRRSRNTSAQCASVWSRL
jgi:hypothetical protein